MKIRDTPLRRHHRGGNAERPISPNAKVLGRHPRLGDGHPAGVAGAGAQQRFPRGSSIANAAWVFDEAHCLSSGGTTRPDTFMFAFHARTPCCFDSAGGCVHRHRQTGM
jgi:hypothetical protein